jgi:hypothetical protein
VTGRAAGRALLVAAALLLLGSGCSDSGKDDDGGASDSSTPAAADAGGVLVTLDGEEQELALTTCTVDEDRLAFQGADGDGTTVVGVLATDGSSGSVTVSDQDGVHAAGQAVGHPLDELELDGLTASGSGDFAVQSYGEVEDDVRPVEDTGETVPGTFEVDCET